MLGVTNSAYGGLYTIGGLLQSGGLGSFSGGAYGVGGAGLGLNESATSSPYALGKQQGSYQVKLSAYGQLRSALDHFNTALDKLKSPQSVAPFKATSSSESVLTASASTDAAKAGTYNVTVNQLASAQTLTSATFADANATIVGSGSLTIQVGSYNANLNSFTPAADNTAKTLTITPVSGTLGGIASAINNAGAGVKADVVQVSGGYQLSLTAANTGTENTVKITAADTSGGPLTGNTGLGQLTFDPTATAGNGKNLTESAAAQNAQLTVDGANVTSQSNAVTSAIQNVTLNLSSTGTSAVTVDVNRDSTAFSASAQQFVDAFNALQSTAATLAQPSIS
ncbi:MAG TPA: flagellar hook protein FliD, partial [Betaproteobacteria bacterium]|nr:flagellar hook protein FliD [Betaproteobacteria bacterium]